MIDGHFHRLFNLSQNYFLMREKEINDIFHDKINCKELIEKILETKNNNLFKKEKRILLTKIKNEVDYIKKYLMKKEYEENKLDYEVVDWDYFYQVKDGGHNHVFSHDDHLLTLLGIKFIDREKVYEIVSKNKKIKNPYDITNKIIKKSFLEKDNKLFKDLSKLATKFSFYFEDNTTIEDLNYYR